MEIIEINSQKPYKVFVQNGLLNNVHKEIEKFCISKKIAIISDDNVAKLYLDILHNSLTDSGYDVYDFVFPNGENSKNLCTITKIYDFLCSNRFTKIDLLIALGGGVASDITGFVAATYLRGMDFINIPTSFLAQIDACVGGKNGVNLSFDKNLVGTIYSPKAVFIDPFVLNTLKKSDFLDGIAESVKYALIKSKKLFNLLKNGFCENNLNKIIIECLKIKKEIVEKDEFDKSERLLLNFGHTLAHSIETYYNFSKYSHGQAVAIGILYMTFLCKKYNFLTDSVYEDVEKILKHYSLIFDEKFNIKNLVEIALKDKKICGNAINLILIKDIGESFVKKMSISEFEQFMLGGAENGDGSNNSEKTFWQSRCTAVEK